jgi:hypothetical protein
MPTNRHRSGRSSRERRAAQKRQAAKRIKDLRAFVERVAMSSSDFAQQAQTILQQDNERRG